MAKSYHPFVALDQGRFTMEKPVMAITSYPGSTDVRTALDRIAAEIAQAASLRADRERAAARAYLAGKTPAIPADLEVAQRGLEQLAIIAEYVEIGPRVAGAQAQIDALAAEGDAAARLHATKYELLRRMNTGTAGQDEWALLAPREIAPPAYPAHEGQRDVSDRLRRECEALVALNAPRQYRTDKLLAEIGELDACRRRIEAEHRDLLLAEGLLNDEVVVAA